MNSAEELESQQRELLDILSITLWVLEHPEVNAIRFSGNPRGLAQRIRARIDALGMSDEMADVWSKTPNFVVDAESPDMPGQPADNMAR